MNIIPNFLVSDIIKMIEEQFVSHEAGLQDAFLSEVGLLSEKIGAWLTEKISGAVSDEKK
jgi:hypothetical protein